MLGKDIAAEFALSKESEVYGISRSTKAALNSIRMIHGDLTDKEFLRREIGSLAPDVIVHSAGLVDVDSCERERSYAHELHVETAKTLAHYCPSPKTFVYISTDSVFDGKAGDYSEADQAAPLNYYSLSKYEGEKATLGSGARAFVLRSNIYGFHTPTGRSLVEWGLDQLSSSVKTGGFTDVWFNPLYTKQLARTLVALVSSNEQGGIWHLGTANRVSKYKFLIMLASRMGLRKDLIEPVSVDDFPFTSPRPKNTTLRIEKISAFLGARPSLENGLDELVHDLEKRGGQ